MCTRAYNGPAYLLLLFIGCLFLRVSITFIRIHTRAYACVNVFIPIFRRYVDSSDFTVRVL